MENVKRGKVVVITGATAGVGRAVANEFAHQGAHIGLIARGREALTCGSSYIDTECSGTATRVIGGKMGAKNG